MNLRGRAKNWPALHSSYKFIRAAPSVAFHRWFDAPQLRAVFKALPNTMCALPRLFDAYDAVARLNRQQVPGDIVECGVWNGGCVGVLAMAHKRTAGPQRRIHLFDSFAGLPQPTPEDDQEFRAFVGDSRGTQPDGPRQATGACVGLNEERVEQFLTGQLKLDRELFVFHVGWFQDTIPKCDIDAIALLRLDGDWYASTRTCLEGLYDRVVSNGIVIIDDFGTFSGCRKAVDEFLESRNCNPELYFSDESCVYFVKP